MVRHIALASMALALASCASGPVSGPGKLASPAQPGYVTSSAGVVKSGFGLCWHTRDWSPDMAVAPCDPVAVAKAPVQAPAIEPKTLPAPRIEPAAKIEPAAPPPAPQQLRRAPVIHKVALDTELLFDFDSAVLRPAGRAKLDQIALQLHGARVESIEATGHADRIATRAYNQGLSEQRARAVTAYLRGLGYAGQHVRAEGRGESEPVTGARCDGLGREHRDNLKLVRCLQPDRRVELEVRGTKKGEA